MEEHGSEGNYDIFPNDSIRGQEKDGDLDGNWPIS